MMHVCQAMSCMVVGGCFIFSDIEDHELTFFIFMYNFYSDIHKVCITHISTTYPSWFYVAFIISYEHEWLSRFHVVGIHRINRGTCCMLMHKSTHTLMHMCLFIHRHVVIWVKHSCSLSPFSSSPFSFHTLLHFLSFFLCHWNFLSSSHILLNLYASIPTLFFPHHRLICYFFLFIVICSVNASICISTLWSTN